MTRNPNKHDEKQLQEHLGYLRLTSIREHYEPEAKVAAFETALNDYADTAKSELKGTEPPRREARLGEILWSACLGKLTNGTT